MTRYRTISTLLAGWVINTHVYSDNGQRFSSLAALKHLANKNNGEVAQADILFNVSCHVIIRFVSNVQRPCVLSCKLYRDRNVLACHAHWQRYGLKSVEGDSNLGHVIAHLPTFSRIYLFQRLFTAIYYDIPISLRRLQIFLPSGCGPLAACSVF
jgi:hypothetical protein